MEDGAIERCCVLEKGAEEELDSGELPEEQYKIRRAEEDEGRKETRKSTTRD